MSRWTTLCVDVPLGTVGEMESTMSEPLNLSIEYCVS